MPFEKELSCALDAARKAGELILRDYEAFVPIPNAPVNISTETDRNSQELILQHLHNVFPDDALCAEENTPALASATRQGRRIWIVDPIDGTRGFAMKNGEFSVMIGLVEGEEVVVGVVLEPVAGRMTYATKGGGCWLQTGTAAPVRCHVSACAKLEEAALVQSHSKKKDEASIAVCAVKPARVIELYSAGVKMALIARGGGELYVNIYSRFHDWDICAGDILVTEAGGRVTTLQGEEVRYNGPNHAQLGGLLATNSVIHDVAVERMKSTNVRGG